MSITLRPHQVQLVTACVNEWENVHGDIRPVFQEAFDAMSSMVLDLPNCLDLGHSDVQWLCFEVAQDADSEGQGVVGALSMGGNRELLLAVTAALQRAIESVPRTYRVTIPLPLFPAIGPGEVQLRSDIKIVFSGPSLAAKTPTNALARSALRLEPNAMLHIEARGYMAYGMRTVTMLRVLSIAKQFAVLMLALDDADRLFRNQEDVQMSIEEVGTGLSLNVPLPTGVGRALCGLQPRMSALTVPIDLPRSATDAAFGREAENAEDKRLALENRWEPIRSALAHAEAFPDAARILTAAEWYLDSIEGDDPTMAYIVACIGIESIFNDEVHLSEMTKRLGDRYAFMFGKTPTERKQLAKTFSDVFLIRGELVHARKPHLSPREHRLLQDAQKILYHSLVRELSAMRYGVIAASIERVKPGH